MNEPFHPLAGIFPLLSGRAFDALVEDVRQNGVREPIWRHTGGLIIDGRNRWRAAREAGVECPEQWFASGDKSVLDFVISMNLHRRHLDESQRAMVAGKLATLRDGQRADRVAGSIDLPTAAEMLNVGEASVKRARVVLDEAIPEVVQLVEDGKLAVSAAAAIAKAEPERQRRVAAKVKDGARPQAAIGEVKKEGADGTAPAPPTGRYRTIVIDPPWEM